GQIRAVSSKAESTPTTVAAASTSTTPPATAWRSSRALTAEGPASRTRRAQAPAERRERDSRFLQAVSAELLEPSHQVATLSCRPFVHIEREIQCGVRARGHVRLQGRDRRAAAEETMVNHSHSPVPHG